MSDPVRAALACELDTVIVPLVARHAERICLVDPPGHANVGDSAILLGELAFLRRHFPRSHLSYVDVDTYSSRADRAIERASILLLHGGGNFGDLWPRHHTLRKTMLRTFLHKPIVQLPQSIRFDDVAERDATADVIARARDFTIVTRDVQSLRCAQQHFQCSNALAPDMAFAIDWLRHQTPVVDYVCLLRTDKEKLADHDGICRLLKSTGGTVEVCDWLDDPETLPRRLDHVLRRFARRSPMNATRFGATLIAGRRAYAMNRLRVGSAMLSRGRRVITDRLHAHIMCCMLGIPHFVFDSYDGKVSAMHFTWTHRYRCAQFVNGVDQLAERLSSERATIAP